MDRTGPQQADAGPGRCIAEGIVRTCVGLETRRGRDQRDPAFRRLQECRAPGFLERAAAARVHDADFVEQPLGFQQAFAAPVRRMVVGHRDHADAHGLHIGVERRLPPEQAISIARPFEGLQVEEHALAIGDGHIAAADQFEYGLQFGIGASRERMRIEQVSESHQSEMVFHARGFRRRAQKVLGLIRGLCRRVRPLGHGLRADAKRQRRDPAQPDVRPGSLGRAPWKAANRFAAHDLHRVSGTPAARSH